MAEKTFVANRDLTIGGIGHWKKGEEVTGRALRQLQAIGDGKFLDEKPAAGGGKKGGEG